MSIPDQHDSIQSTDNSSDGFPMNFKIILGIIGVLVIFVVVGLLVFPKTRSAIISQATATLTVTATKIETTVLSTPTVATGPAECKVFNVLPTANPTDEALFPPTSDDEWVQGEKEATVTFMVYSDFQCPYCASLDPVLSQLYNDYPQDVRLVFRPFPLISIHDKALLATQAVEAAGKQKRDLFFVMEERLFSTQSTWSEMTLDEFKIWVTGEAITLGVDEALFVKDLESPEIVQKVQKNLDEATRIGIPGTPFMIINGVPYQGPNDYANLQAIVEIYKLKDRQFSECPPMTIDTKKQYKATLHTSKGDVIINLYADKAPLTVNSFIFLAKNGWYNGIPFHRVIPDFVAQSGDPTGTGYGSPGYAFGNEIDPDLKYDKPGVVGMANSGPASNGSQFFITYAALSQLDGSYTIFGQVIEGMKVVENLTARDSGQETPLADPDLILSVNIEEN